MLAAVASKPSCFWGQWTLISFLALTHPTGGAYGLIPTCDGAGRGVDLVMLGIRGLATATTWSRMRLAPVLVVRG